jgi:hypothetical protein
VNNTRVQVHETNKKKNKNVKSILMAGARRFAKKAYCSRRLLAMTAGQRQKNKKNMAACAGSLEARQ